MMTRKYQVSLVVFTLAPIVTLLTFAYFTKQVGADRFSGLCPSSYPRQVSFNGTGRCYTVGSAGPCPKMMVVSSNPFNPNFGKCRCKSLGSSCFGRPLLEWEDRCYFEFSQGPCRKGQWLVRGKHSSPTCQKSPCPLTENQRELLRADIPRKNFYFTLDNSFECYRTGSQAFCGEGQKAYFLGSEPFARCVSYEPWDCDHYSGPPAAPSSSQGLFGRFGNSNSGNGGNKQSQGDPGTAPGFGVPYDGI